MPLYDTTNLTSSTNIYEIALNTNMLVGSFIGIGILITIFIITYVWVVKLSDSIAGLGAGAFITLVSASMLYPLGFISFTIYKIVLLLSGGVILLTFLTKE